VALVVSSNERGPRPPYVREDSWKDSLVSFFVRSFNERSGASAIRADASAILETVGTPLLQQLTRGNASTTYPVIHIDHTLFYRVPEPDNNKRRWILLLSRLFSCPHKLLTSISTVA